MDKITGKQNQLIKDTKKLLASAKARRDARSFVLEGARLCFDVLHSFYTVALVLVTADCMARYPAVPNRKGWPGAMGFASAAQVSATRMLTTLFRISSAQAATLARCKSLATRSQRWPVPWASRWALC